MFPSTGTETGPGGSEPYDFLRVQTDFAKTAKLRNPRNILTMVVADMVAAT